VLCSLVKEVPFVTWNRRAKAKESTEVEDKETGNALILRHQAPREHHAGDIGRQAEEGEEGNGVAAGPELAEGHALGALGDEELAVALEAAVHGNEENGEAVDGKEGADGVELLGEDLEDDEREGELAEGGAHVGALEGALGGADFDEPGGMLG
jgi:hypothetical protein